MLEHPGGNEEAQVLVAIFIASGNRRCSRLPPDSEGTNRHQDHREEAAEQRVLDQAAIRRRHLPYILELSALQPAGLHLLQVFFRLGELRIDAGSQPTR